MRYLFLSPLLFAFFFAPAQTLPAGAQPGRYDSLLLHQVDSMYGVDQERRQRWGTSPTDDSLSRRAAGDSFVAADRRHYSFLRATVTRIGFPDSDVLGYKGTRHFWLLVQHQDEHPSFQDSVLALMEKAIYAGKAYAEDYAYLFDRVRVNTGRLQRYGTQMQPNAAHTSYEPKPLEDPATVNERRKNFNLSPIEDYIKMMNERNAATLH